jgi:hypothetical protein
MNPALPAQQGAIVVDPNAMLTVVLNLPTGPIVIHAINCRYVPVVVPVMIQTMQVPHRGVAVEVVHDPGAPNPVAAYYRDPNALLVELYPPNLLMQVSPYVPPLVPAPAG